MPYSVWLIEFVGETRQANEWLSVAMKNKGLITILINTNYTIIKK